MECGRRAECRGRVDDSPLTPTQTGRPTRRQFSGSEDMQVSPTSGQQRRRQALSTAKRLELSAGILAMIDLKRRQFHNPSIGALLEARIVERELSELEREWVRSCPRSTRSAGSPAG